MSARGEGEQSHVDTSVEIDQLGTLTRVASFDVHIRVQGSAHGWLRPTRVRGVLARDAGGAFRAFVGVSDMEEDKPLNLKKIKMLLGEEEYKLALQAIGSLAQAQARSAVIDLNKRA